MNCCKFKFSGNFALVGMFGRQAATAKRMKIRLALSVRELLRTENTFNDVQGAANKSNPLPCFVNVSTTNRNFCKKIYTTIYHSYLRIIAELY